MYRRIDQNQNRFNGFCGRLQASRRARADALARPGAGRGSAGPPGSAREPRWPPHFLPPHCPAAGPGLCCACYRAGQAATLGQPVAAMRHRAVAFSISGILGILSILSLVPVFPTVSPSFPTRTPPCWRYPCWNSDQTANAATRTCHPTRRKRASVRSSALSAPRAPTAFSAGNARTARASYSSAHAAQRTSWQTIRRRANASITRPLAAGPPEPPAPALVYPTGPHSLAENRENGARSTRRAVRA